MKYFKSQDKEKNHGNKTRRYIFWLMMIQALISAYYIWFSKDDVKIIRRLVMLSIMQDAYCWANYWNR
jgi:hypothetical protein